MSAAKYDENGKRIRTEAFIVFEPRKRSEPVSFGNATRKGAIKFCREQWEREGKVRTLFVGPMHHSPGMHWTWAQFSAQPPEAP